MFTPRNLPINDQFHSLRSFNNSLSVKRPSASSTLMTGWPSCGTFGGSSGRLWPSQRRAFCTLLRNVSWNHRRRIVHLEQHLLAQSPSRTLLGSCTRLRNAQTCLFWDRWGPCLSLWEGHVATAMEAAVHLNPRSDCVPFWSNNSYADQNFDWINGNSHARSYRVKQEKENLMWEKKETLDSLGT